MTQLDYFLYDNRTAAPWGRDWGVKAATGALASRADLRSEFGRYCDATRNDVGALTGFGAAIGGLRPRASDGYLLCVTLEGGGDHFGRPSYAIVGLWCPDAATLIDLVEGDPIASARAVVSAPLLPSSIQVQPGNGAVPPMRRRSGGATIHRFVPGTSPREVLSILLGALRGRTAPPSILGITGSGKLRDLTQRGYDRVYSHPVDDQTRRRLDQLASPTADLEPLPATAIAPVPLRSSPPLPSPGKPFPMAIAAALVLTLLGIAASFIILRMTESDLLQPDPVTELLHPTDKATIPIARVEADDSTSPSIRANEQSPEARLGTIRGAVATLRQLDPEQLRSSRGYRIVHETPVPDRTADRDRLRAAYDGLLTFRKRMIDRSSVSYVAFYTDENSSLSPPGKLKKIAEILKAIDRGTDACREIENALRFDYESHQSLVGRWCQATIDIEAAADGASP